MGFLILAVNPGSTSTKLALFGDGEPLREKTVDHSAAELSRWGSVAAQEEWRAGFVRAFLDRDGGPGLDAAVGRGGLLEPLPGGTWRVTERMLAVLRAAERGEHASNLGAPLAARAAREAGCPAFVVDPVVVDELAPEARLTGLPEMPRRSVFHALSQRAAARRAAAELQLGYGEAHLVVAHLGGGVSVGAHREGRVIEVNNALDGEGPMAPERSGALPSRDLARLCFSGRATPEEVERKIAGGGGLVAHLGTNDLREVEERLGEPAVREVFEALAYGIAKAVTGCFAALGRTPQAIVLTGGLCRSRELVDRIRDRVGFAAPVYVYPENLEMRALAEGALRVLRGEEEARDYR